MDVNVPEQKKPPSKKKTSLALFMFVMMLVVFGVLRVQQINNPIPALSNDQPKSATATSTQDEVERMQISTLVAALTTVPPGLPIVEYVSDTYILKKLNPDFYKEVQRGDWVVSYSTLVVIYRPSSNTIVNSAPIQK